MIGTPTSNALSLPMVKNYLLWESSQILCYKFGIKKSILSRVHGNVWQLYKYLPQRVCDIPWYKLSWSSICEEGAVYMLKLVGSTNFIQNSWNFVWKYNGNNMTTHNTHLLKAVPRSRCHKTYQNISSCTGEIDKPT